MAASPISGVIKIQREEGRDWSVEAFREEPAAKGDNQGEAGGNLSNNAPGSNTRRPVPIRNQIWIITTKEVQSYSLLTTCIDFYKYFKNEHLWSDFDVRRYLKVRCNELQLNVGFLD